MHAHEFFSVEKNWQFSEFFNMDDNPIFWLKDIESAILTVLKSCKNCHTGVPKLCHIGKDVYIDETVKLPHICVIDGPAYIGKGTEIRPFSYIRQNVIIGENCVIGNSTEIKNSILLNNVQVPHFNYVGDSILGNFSHLGAGAICANLRLDRQPITVRYNGGKVMTEMRKIGAIIGDHSDIACNVVLNPGTVLQQHSKIFSGKQQTGAIPEHVAY